MMKIAFGLITALMLAACSTVGTNPAADAGNPMTSGVGHPSVGYPGPRTY